MEWGHPRVPVLVAKGGDEPEQGGGESGEVRPNPRPEWSDRIMRKITDGGLKRVKYWLEEEHGEDQHGAQDQPTGGPQPKRRRTNEKMVVVVAEV